MWDKLGGIVGLLFGSCCILFRKNIPRFLIRKQIEESSTRRAKKTKESFQKLKEMKLEGLLYRMLEIMAVVIGVCWLLISIHEFFPQSQKYVGYFLEFFILSLFAGGVAALVELTLIFRFLWRNVRKYIQDRDSLSWTVQNSSGGDRLNAVSAGRADDPVLRSLQKKAIVYSIISFIPLYVFFLFAAYAIIRLTS